MFQAAVGDGIAQPVIGRLPEVACQRIGGGLFAHPHGVGALPAWSFGLAAVNRPHHVALMLAIIHQRRVDQMHPARGRGQKAKPEIMVEMHPALRWKGQRQPHQPGPHQHGHSGDIVAIQQATQAGLLLAPLKREHRAVQLGRPIRPDKACIAVNKIRTAGRERRNPALQTIGMPDVILIAERDQRRVLVQPLGVDQVQRLAQPRLEGPHRIEWNIAGNYRQGQVRGCGRCCGRDQRRGTGVGNHRHQMTILMALIRKRPHLRRQILRLWLEHGHYDEYARRHHVLSDQNTASALTERSCQCKPGASGTWSRARVARRVIQP